MQQLMNHYSVSDASLLQRLSCGEREAFAQIYRRHSQRVFAYLLAMTTRRDRAEELLQVVFVRALRHAESLRGINDALPYLLMTARNLVFDQHKSKERKLRDDGGLQQQQWLCPLPGPEELTINAERCNRLQNALMALPDELREVVVLRIYDDLPFKQIAQVMNENMGTVFYRYQNALRRMKETLND